MPILFSGCWRAIISYQLNDGSQRPLLAPASYVSYLLSLSPFPRTQNPYFRKLCQAGPQGYTVRTYQVSASTVFCV